MSGSIMFNHGPFQGWSVAVYATYRDGQLVRTLIQLATPYPYRDGQPASLSGVLSLAPGFDGWEQARAAEHEAGPRRMVELLEWIVEAHRAVLDHSTSIGAADRRHWQTIVDRADESRADCAARYPDGVVPPFEVVGRLAADRATGTMVGAL